MLKVYSLKMEMTSRNNNNIISVNDNIRMYKKWNLIMYKNIHY